MLIPRNLLLAVSYAAAKKDIRYYLNGVMVDVQPTQTYMVATTGNIMLCAIHRTVDEPALGQHILPLEVVQLACKDKRDFLTLEVMPVGHPDGSRHKFQLGAISGDTVDGKFPDWRRVVPKFMEQGAHTHLWLDLAKPFLDAAKALALQSYNVQGWPGEHAHNAAYVQFVGREQDIFGIYMPRKADSFEKPYWR